jgi:excisionase family DNA binding protein
MKGYTVPEAAAALGINYMTLRGAVLKGEVKTVMLNGRKRITPSEMTRLRRLLATETISSNDERDL